MRLSLGFPGFLALGLATALPGCGGKAAAPAAQAEAKRAVVRVATAEPASAMTEIALVGQVAPDHSFTLAFKTPGVVRAIPINEGDRVKKGQILAELDPKDVDALLSQAEEQAEKATRDLDRARKLHDKGFTSDAALQDAQMQVRYTRQAADAAKANRGYATLIAPNDGVVLKRNVEANGVVAAGAPVLVISDMSRAFVLTAGLADRDAVRVKVGDAAEATFDAYPGQTFTATVSEIAGDADPRTGTFQVKLRIADEKAELRSGLIGHGAIRPATEAVAGLAIPVDAVLEGHGDKGFVYVVDPATGAARRTRVTLGRISGSSVAVPAGLSQGAEVVVDGAGYLSDGEKVEIATAAAQ